jgi:hypothetical protein
VTHPEFSALVDYWFGERDDIEEHLFGCAHCSGRLEELAALGSGIRAAFRRGALAVVISSRLLERMRREGLRLREYRVAPGGSVACSMAAEDDFVVSHLTAPLAGVERLDLVRFGAGGAETRMADIPFDAATGEVVVVPPAAALRKAGAHTQRIRLIAHEEGRERIIGEYTFNHTPG